MSETFLRVFTILGCFRRSAGVPPGSAPARPGDDASARPPRCGGGSATARVRAAGGEHDAAGERFGAGEGGDVQVRRVLPGDEPGEAAVRRPFPLPTTSDPRDHDGRREERVIDSFDTLSHVPVRRHIGRILRTLRSCLPSSRAIGGEVQEPPAFSDAVQMLPLLSARFVRGYRHGPRYIFGEKHALHFVFLTSATTLGFRTALHVKPFLPFLLNAGIWDAHMADRLYRGNRG